MFGGLPCGGRRGRQRADQSSGQRGVKDVKGPVVKIVETVSVMSVKGEGPLKELARCEHSWHDLSTFCYMLKVL